MEIRDERPADAAAIHDVTATAFATAPHSDGTEAAIVDRLRAAGALTLSLVAEDGGAIVGHVAFSPILIDRVGERWFGLGPVSVAPGRQRQGIGSALIVEGLARLRAEQAKGCVVLGDPVYYRRFGFAPDAALQFPGLPPEYFQCLAFDGARPAGIVSYHAAFG